MSELLFNKSGLLQMNRDERNQYFKDAVSEFMNLGTRAARESQHKVYAKSIKELLKIDIEVNPDLDPYKEVTGFPLRTFYLDKYKAGKEGIDISLAQTDFISAAEILPLGSFKGVPLEEDIWGEKIVTKKVSTTACFRLIGPVLINEENNWQLNFSFCDLSVYNLNKNDPRRMHIWKGIIVLEQEPLDKLRASAYFPTIYKMLGDVANWFNHDMPGHGTLDFHSEGPEGTCCHGIKHTAFLPFEQPYWNIRTLRKSSIQRFSKSIWLEERRRESIQFEIIEACMRRRPALEKFICIHMYKFKKLLRAAKNQDTINNKEMSYFLGVYVYCLARIIRFKKLFDMCCKTGTIDSLAKIVGYNNNEELILRHIHDHYTGTPYVNRDIYNSTEHMRFEDLQFISHKDFFKQIYSRMFV